MRSKKGIVTGASRDKTIIAIVHTYKNHPKYKKRYRVSQKYHIHNPENKKFTEGDEVTFHETRPLSKLKRWILEKPQVRSEACLPAGRAKHPKPGDTTKSPPHITN